MANIIPLTDKLQAFKNTVTPSISTMENTKTEIANYLKASLADIDVKKVKISYTIFPISSMITSLINFGLSFIALIIVMLICGQTFYWTILLTLTILPAVLLFSLGLGFCLSCMFVFFRDIKHLYAVFLTLWIYVTPIFYSPTIITNKLVSAVIYINPMTQFITAFRNMIQWGTIPSLSNYLISYAWAIGMLVIGYIIFRANRKKYILYI